MPKKNAPVAASIDIDHLVREEVTEWFTSNRKGLETVFRQVAEQVEAVWRERVNELNDKIRDLEEEAKRMRAVLTMVRSQVGEQGTAND